MNTKHYTRRGPSKHMHSNIKKIHFSSAGVVVRAYKIVKDITAVKAVSAIGGNNWELQL